MKEFVLRKEPSEKKLEPLKALLGSRSLALVCWNRGLKTEKDIEEFTVAQDLLATSELYDVEAVFRLLVKHKKLDSKIVVYGDYDADGAVAGAVLWRFLAKTLKVNATVYIPDRHEEGYGLNRQALDTLAKSGVGLVITVDCGIRDSAIIAGIMASYPIDIIVTDHHQPSGELPKTVVVHPLYPGHESKNRFTSGGVVAWKVVRYLEDKFSFSHEYSDSVVDLVGISLVTDMMPLIGENREILKRAIRKMRSSPSLGTKVLAEITQVPVEDLSTYHLGFVLGPRLNASGRIGNQYTSVRLLSTDSLFQARKYAQEVHEINVTRQALTKSMLEAAEATRVIVAQKIAIASGEGWEDGIIGLVAGKLMNSLGLPAIAVSIDSAKGIAKGSARSFGDFNITGFFSGFPDIFERFGGHSNAAGFTLKSTDIQILLTAISTEIEAKYSTYIPVNRQFVDSVVSRSELTEHFFEMLSKLEPFGQANLPPIFAVKGKIAQFSLIGQQGNHVRIELETEDGTLKAMAFDGLKYLKKLEQGVQVVLVGKPKLNEYNGRRELTFFVEDVVTNLDNE